MRPLRLYPSCGSDAWSATRRAQSQRTVVSIAERGGTTLPIDVGTPVLGRATLVGELARGVLVEGHSLPEVAQVGVLGFLRARGFGEST